MSRAEEVVLLSPKFVPAAVGVWRATRLTDIEARYARSGIMVEIEAGPIGVVVYGPDRASVSAVAHDTVLAAQRGGDPRAEVEHVGPDDAEPLATRWIAVVTLDWGKQKAAS